MQLLCLREREGLLFNALTFALPRHNRDSYSHKSNT